jgi:hypothetical protein
MAKVMRRIGRAFGATFEVIVHRADSSVNDHDEAASYFSPTVL